MKKTIAYFDMETTSINVNKAFPVQVALKLVEYSFDTKIHSSIKEEYNTIIKPINYIISDENASIHGITQDKALKVGENLEDVINNVIKLMRGADLICGHNIIKYDLRILERLVEEFNISTYLFLHDRHTKSKFIDTMYVSAHSCGKYFIDKKKLSDTHEKLYYSISIYKDGILNCPSQHIINKTKLINREKYRPNEWPSRYLPPTLGEAYLCYLNKSLEGAHDAMVDINACQEIMEYLWGNLLRLDLLFNGMGFPDKINTINVSLEEDLPSFDLLERGGQLLEWLEECDYSPHMLTKCYSLPIEHYDTFLDYFNELLPFISSTWGTQLYIKGFKKYAKGIISKKYPDLADYYYDHVQLQRQVARNN
jgi:hypothetical protein